MVDDPILGKSEKDPKVPSKRRHDKALQIRMTAELLDLVQRASLSAGLSTSGWVRDRLSRIARREVRESSDETPRRSFRED